MTREEEIKKQAEIYTDNRDNYVEWSDGWEAHNDIKFVEKAFIEGAKWADAHPISSWISVKEMLPPEEKDGLSIKVLVVSTKGKIDFSRFDYDMEGWISPILDVEFTHWQPLPKLPKE